MKEIASKIPNSKFAVVEKAGHIPNMEQPEAFNKLLKDFYAQDFTSI
jgi:pimeloyl-ACP methyl ester carboxylesterase